MLHEPVILFRYFNLETKEEQAICAKHFKTVQSRSDAENIKNKIVIGRYSVLPFYKELENDLSYFNSKLINSFREHRYIADLKNWALDVDVDEPLLTAHTPRTWLSFQDVPDNIPLILKGETNSRKDKWNTHMFAKNKTEAIQIYLKLKNDRFFENQEIYIREYLKLKTYFTDPVNEQPVTKEFRFFCYQDKVLAGGYYWSNHLDQVKKIEEPKISDVPESFLNKLTNIISRSATFYVVDVAQLENGEWILIELNDGQMSGLSEVDPNELYSNLKQCFIE